MARKMMLPAKERSLLQLIKKCLESEQCYNVPAEVVSDPTELKELLRILTQRLAENASEVEDLQANLEIRGFGEEAGLVVKKTEWMADAMQAFLYASIVLMRQKYQLSACENAAKKTEAEMEVLRKKLRAAEKQLARCNRCGHLKKGKA